MIRASSFCTRRYKKACSVRLVADDRDGTDDIDSSDDSTLAYGFVNHALLRQANLIHGQLAWIQCQQKRIVVKVLLRRETNGDAAMNVDESKGHDDLITLPPPVIRLSPLAAANLNIVHDLQSRALDCMGSITPCRDEPVLAESVHLRYYARPTAVLGRTEQGSDEQSTDDKMWALPVAGTIVRPNTTTCVGRNDGETCWYQVLRVNSDRNDNHRYYKTTRTTTYSLEAPAFAACPRLPPLSNNIPPHPNLSQFASTIQCLQVSRAAECVLHVIGTDTQHHVGTLVEAAAAQTGRRIVTLPRGWAAYAFHANGGGKLFSNGGLVDKLHGLQAALQCAKQSVPALLHVYLDSTEFSPHDEVQYQDEQSRIWSILMETLRECDYGACNYSLVPPLVVVVSTATTLQRGPLMESLVFETIQASMPNKVYIQYLWRNVMPEVPSEDVISILNGRPACEIETLRRHFIQSFQSAQDDRHPTSMLQEVAKKLDIRRKSGLARIPQVQWSDVGGLHSVRREILDTIELPLQHPHLFSNRRSGILLYGPPGTGKTLVAKAVATECNLPFLSVKGPELLGSFVGESEENIRTVFAQARQLAKANKIPACVLFFDELDSLAPRRGDQASGGGSVMDRVVATLFAELDRNVADAIVYCLGATNRPDLLDPALLRPGRLDRLVYLGMSSVDDQVKILAAQMRKLKLDRDVLELARLVVNHIPANLSGADLSMIVSKALMRATERLCDEADQEVAAMGKEGDDVASLEQVLASWDDTRLTPVVTLDDLQWAAQYVIPSVSEEELKGYERMRDQFQTTLSSR